MVVGGCDLGQTCFLLGSTDFNTFSIIHLYNYGALESQISRTVGKNFPSDFPENICCYERNSWFFSNCLAVKKQEAIPPRHQQSLLKTVGLFLSTNEKLDK